MFELYPVDNPQHSEHNWHVSNNLIEASASDLEDGANESSQRSRGDYRPPFTILNRTNTPKPFIALSKTTASPRAAVDLITQATTSPSTYIFAELLAQPTIATLSESDDPTHRAYYTLLSLFSHGTYETYKATPDLPPLNEAQTLKLRQLSLLSLARERENLSYAALMKRLGLESERAVEDLVITAVYAGLINATLDPARQAVQVTSIAPLRDLSPGTVPDMARILKTWSGRCASTLGDLDTQIQNIRANAATREKEKRLGEEKMKKARDKQGEETEEQAHAPNAPSLRPHGKRLARMSDEGSMEVDEPANEGSGSKRKK